MNASRYEEAGVSIDAQDRAIESIRRHVRDTRTARVLSDIGSFGGLFDISFPEMEKPALVSSADGVGTKLKIAFMAERYDTVGQCLVNHCVNDILVQGARPLFFMDYIATGKLRPETVEALVAGMAQACRENETAILGGEMAEMPGFYQPGEFDVAGFIVGVVDQAKILGADRVRAGSKLIGLASTGLHTNGYSLARKILFEEQGLSVADELPGCGQSVADALLAVHRSYFPAVWSLLQNDAVQAMAHITGGGLLDNLPRVLPEGLDAAVRLDAFEPPALFRYLVEKGGVDREEAYRVFNMGIGMALIVDPGREAETLAEMSRYGLEAWPLGEIVAGRRQVRLT